MIRPFFVEGEPILAAKERKERKKEMKKNLPFCFNFPCVLLWLINPFSSDQIENLFCHAFRRKLLAQAYMPGGVVGPLRFAAAMREIGKHIRKFEGRNSKFESNSNVQMIE